MEIRLDLSYSKTHEWVKIEGSIAQIGITDYAQDAMGDIVYVDLPEVGDVVEVGKTFAEAESVKAVADINSPISGVVCEINEELIDSPELINEKPFDAWLIKVKDITDTQNLLTSEAYKDFCEENS